MRNNPSLYIIPFENILKIIVKVEIFDKFFPKKYSQNNSKSWNIWQVFFQWNILKIF